MFTICMAVGKQHSIDAAQPILGKPFECGSLEVLSRIDKNCPEKMKINDNQPLMETMSEPKLATYTFFPPTPSTRTIADVFLLMFFLPSGVSVERHVWHGSSSGGAVRHEMFGTLPEVPVPKKIRSNAGVNFC
jgi:hypothetical protein